MVYVRDTRLCELLLGLLRRLPWVKMKDPALSQVDLRLLPCLLDTLGGFLEATACVRSSQQAAAFAALSKRCQSQARTAPPCRAD